MQSGADLVHLFLGQETSGFRLNGLAEPYAKRRLEGGAAEIGDAERAMACARAFMPLVGWRRRTVRSFLAFSTVTKQLAFWHAHLDTSRVRATFDALMSPAILRIAYAPQLLSFLPARFGEVLRKRLLRGFAREANATNPYVRALLLGESSDERRPTNSRVQFVLGDGASYLESCAPGSLDAFSLSNILDGAAPS